MSHALLPVLLAALLALNLSACRQPGEPKPPRFDEQATARTGLGEFNLHLRNGQGGWKNQPDATEQDLLNGLRKEVR